MSTRSAAVWLAAAAILLTAACANVINQRARLYETARQFSERENARMAAASGDRFGQWQVQCPSPQSSLECWAETAAQTQNGDILWLQVRPVGDPSGTRAFEVHAIVPLGVDLRRGIAFAVPGFESFALPATTCTAAGCLVAFRASSASWLGMRAQAGLDVAYRFAGAPADTASRFSTAGLAAALSGLR